MTIERERGLRAIEHLGKATLGVELALVHLAEEDEPELFQALRRLQESLQGTVHIVAERLTPKE